MKPPLWRFRVVTAGLVSLVCALVLEAGSYLYLNSQDRYVLRVFEQSDAGGVEGIGVKKHFEQVWQTPEFKVAVRTNNLGLREDRDYRGEEIDIGFFGDSHTFGHGVEVQERFSNILQGCFPYKNVFSFSYLNGWTTPHYYCFLKKHPQLAPDIAFVCLSLGNDLTCDMEETELAFDNSGELRSARSLSRKVTSRGFLVSKDTNRATLGLRKCWLGELLIREGLATELGIRPVPVKAVNAYPSPEFDRGLLDDTNRLGLQFVVRMKGELERQAKRLIVFLIPWGFHVGDYRSYHDPATTRDIRQHHYLTQAVTDWLTRHGVECIDPVPRFVQEESQGTRLYFASDMHLNAAGHRVAAGLMGEYLLSTAGQGHIINHGPKPP